MSRTLYRSLSQLEVWQPYTIVQCSEKRNGNILLYLRGSKEEGEFMSLLLLPHSARKAFRETKRHNEETNGDDAKLILHITGYTHYGWALVRISGKGFTRLLG